MTTYNFEKKNNVPTGRVPATAEIVLDLDGLIYGVKILQINLVCCNKISLCLSTQFSLNMHKLRNYNV